MGKTIRFILDILIGPITILLIGYRAFLRIKKDADKGPITILLIGYGIFQEASKIGGIIVCIIALIILIFEVISFVSNNKSE